MDPLIGPHRTALRLRPDLLASGFTDAEIATSVRGGKWERLSRGIYAEPVSVATDRHEAERARYVRRVLAGSIAAPAAVVSHLSAAALYGLPVARAPLDTVHLTRPGRDNGRRRAGIRFHAGRLKPEDIVIREGIRITSPARTLIDVGRLESARNAVAIVDAALHRDLAVPSEIAAALARAAHGRGMPQARRALSQADGRSESVGESFARFVLAEAGLPRPDLQVEVRTAGGAFLGRCDFGYPQFAVLTEFDGDVKYRRMRRPGESIEDTVLREKAREDGLRAAGFVIVRLVWRDLFDLVTLARRIHGAATLGSRAMAAGMVTGRCAVAAPRPAIA